MQLTKVEALLTPQTLKKRFFFGVDLKDGNGNVLSDDVFESHITQAIDWMEHHLELGIVKKEHTEFVDYQLAAYRQYCFIAVPMYPINTVTSVELFFAETMKVTFPGEWYKIYHNSGQIQLLPTMSTMSAVIIQQSGQLLPRAIRSEFAPQLLKVVYSSGFDPDKIPALINETIGLRATNLILNFLGDISPAGPGISSISQSIDGMSQATATAISPTNALYGARMLNNDKYLAENLKLLKKRYKRIKLQYM